MGAGVELPFTLDKGNKNSTSQRHEISHENIFILGIWCIYTSAHKSQDSSQNNRLSS